MCGITGYINYKGKTISKDFALQNILKSLKYRGPDDSRYYFNENLFLGHTKRAISQVPSPNIALSANASQPMQSEDGNYTIVFNGEIFNFIKLREVLVSKGYSFKSNNAPEIVLNLFIDEGISCLNKLEGFFAFAIYDHKRSELYLVRDRFGIKPLLYSYNEEEFVFASEMKALLEFKNDYKIDRTSLFQYFELTYIPPPYTIFEGVFKLEPGKYIKISKNISFNEYYSIESRINKKPQINDYNSTCKHLYNLLEETVVSQLIPDVPLGSFLSGGVDSSIITGLAAKHVSNLKTFSIGFKDAYYDETRYAEIIAQKHKTNHTSFSFTTDDLYDEVFKMLDYIDEPYADSSVIALHLLSKEARKYITVALSGDGGDEIFGGYNKYLAEQKIRQKGMINNLIKFGKPLWQILPQSRSNKVTNTFRKLNRFANAMRFNEADRYWYLSTFSEKNRIDSLIKLPVNNNEYGIRKNQYTKFISANKNDLTDFQLSDIKMVLPGDMLTKTYLMSIANSLEIRAPFLAHKIVEFALSIPYSYRISNKSTKKILKDTFADLLTPAIINRNKHGFEVPMNKWFKTEMKSVIDNDLLNRDFIESQNLFNISAIEHIKNTIFEKQYHDYQALTWSLIVFQYWWKSGNR